MGPGIPRLDTSLCLHGSRQRQAGCSPSLPGSILGEMQIHALKWKYLAGGISAAQVTAACHRGCGQRDRGRTLPAPLSGPVHGPQLALQWHFPALSIPAKDVPQAFSILAVQTE